MEFNKTMAYCTNQHSVRLNWIQSLENGSAPWVTGISSSPKRTCKKQASINNEELGSAPKKLIQLVDTEIQLNCQWKTLKDWTLSSMIIDGVATNVHGYVQELFPWWVDDHTSTELTCTDDQMYPNVTSPSCFYVRITQCHCHRLSKHFCREKKANIIIYHHISFLFDPYNPISSNYKKDIPNFISVGYTPFTRYAQLMILQIYQLS